MKKILSINLILFICHYLGAAPDKKDDADEMDLFEMEAFVVYGGIIDTVDGITGEDYFGGNEVVLGFREKFNELLLQFHRRLLLAEIRHMRTHEAYLQDFKNTLNPLLESFDIQPVQSPKNTFAKERVITQRLINDPFFIIEKLIVWDLDKLERYKDQPIPSKYAEDIRYNPETKKWERRVITEWIVNIWRKNRELRQVIKEQGLNLDDQKGFQMVSSPISRVTTDSFEDVRLNYPIFFNSSEPAEVQVQRLIETYLENLSYIYDPYSWWGRRNVRFRYPFREDIRSRVETTRYKVSDRKWLDPVLTQFLHDVVTIKTKGVDEVYDFAMLTKVRVNRNILGREFDLLNWNKGEDRSVPYDPAEQEDINVGFNNPEGARFVLLDAYRRYGDRFLSLLRDRLLSLEQRTPAKELVTEVLGEVSGIPGEKYIDLAKQAQRAELERFKYQL